MNLYFLVEGRRTEKKIYPAWLKHLLPELTQVKHYNEVTLNNYYLISGEGYPSLYDYIITSIEEINESSKYHYFVVCLDAEENTVDELKDEIYEFIKAQKLVLKNTELVIIMQNRCIETWLLGNRKIYSKQPQHQPLLDYTRHYNVAEKDPEVMEKYHGFNTHAQFHESYLKALFAAKNISYSKRNPGDVLEAFYLEQLLKRITDEPQHLMTFRDFINFCDIIKKELPTSQQIM
jgi:hypothetical protein